ASFIMTRDAHDNSGLMTILDGMATMRRSLALLTLYQQLQKRFDNPKLVQLCEWLSMDAAIIIERFYNLQLKKTLTKFLPKQIKTADLSRILSMIANPLQVRKDENAYALAMHQYASHGYARDRRRLERDTTKHYGYESGQHLALIVSLLLSGLFIV